MWGVGKRNGDLERRLRSSRPNARDEFVRALSRKVAPPRRTLAWSRLAFAAAFTTLLLGTFASLGGIGYTTAGASQAYQTVKKLTAAEKVSVERSSAADQYGPPQEEPIDQGQAEAGEAAGQAIEESETLPFTGISLLSTALAGIALLILGLALRRRERRRS
jgi:hypothetical protein